MPGRKNQGVVFAIHIEAIVVLRGWHKSGPFTGIPGYGTLESQPDFEPARTSAAVFNNQLLQNGHLFDRQRGDGFDM